VTLHEQVSLHLHSSRTTSCQCINGEGKTCEHAGDGVTAIYNSFSDGIAKSNQQQIWPLLNWQRLPGITAVVDPSLLKKCKGNGPDKRMQFVGGVSDGVVGAAAMPLVSDGGLSVLKSYFFVDGGFVALGANLSRAANTTHPVTTTVDVRLLSAVHALVVQAGSKRLNSSQLPPAQSPHRFNAGGAADELAWVWHDGIGYTNLIHTPSAGTTPKAGSSSASNVNDANISSFLVYNNKRTGNWSSLGTHSGTAVLPVFELGIQHAHSGIGAGGYAYSVTANTSLADFEQAKARPRSHPWSHSLSSQVGVEVVANDVGVQAIADARRQQLQAVFWAAGAKLVSIPLSPSLSAAGRPAVNMKVNVSVDAPCLLLLLVGHNRSSGTQATVVTIQLSSTIAESVRVVVSFDGLGAAQGCAKLEGSGCSSPTTSTLVGGAASTAPSPTVFVFDGLPSGNSLGSTATRSCRCTR
jgi:hypothetical protein